MTHAIIGARGDMGKNLLCPLLKRHGDVISVNRGDAQDTWDQAWQADYIWLSVPRDVIPELLAGKTFTPEQVIVDICSIKRSLSSVIQKTGATHLSLHQLHGPFVPLNGQKWVHIQTVSDTDTHPLVQNLLLFLEAQGISFLRAESEEEHDFMIGVTLSLPEMVTVFLDALMEQYAKNAGQATPSMAKLMEWAVPASNVLFSYYIHSINSSADWLRKDLIIGAHADLLASARTASSRLARLTAPDIERYLSKQRVFVESLPQAERKRVRQWIERWFVDSVQKIFAFHKHESIKPKLIIQERADVQTIFPIHKGNISVGIHGIAGSFTHESILRLAEELGISVDKLSLRYLVEADRVIDAVVQGEVDRGVFAMANSGSGAYVSSMHAMSEHTFNVLAVYGMEILQCLIAHPSIASIEHITEVFGHPQAVSQCKRTFEEKYPRLALKFGEDSDDTALCVKRIADGELPRTTATLASQIAAGLYKMNILEYGMHHDPFNTTTFLVIGKKQ